ncbi:MAG: hypothetical protein MZU97_26695 [Bacillus subtilis]|nr:hypothetical protein [Bacillus subtilis]
MDATVKSMGRELARLELKKPAKEDLKDRGKIAQEFAAELTAIRAKTEALEARATRIEAKNEEQDNRLTVLEKLRVYGDVNFGGYADIAGNPGNEFTDAISSVGRTRLKC